MTACERWLHVTSPALPRHGIACCQGAVQLVQRVSIGGCTHVRLCLGMRCLFYMCDAWVLLTQQGA